MHKIKMPCQVCNANDHTYDECSSEYAIKIEKKTIYWFNQQISYLYMTNKFRSKYKIWSLSRYLFILTRSELLYLCREIFMVDPCYRKDILIYYFIYHFMKIYIYFNENNETSFTKRQIEYMKIDMEYWNNLTIQYSNDLDRAFDLRMEKIKKLDNSPEKRWIIPTNINLIIDCPICLEDNFKQTDCSQLSCSHYICKSCINKIIKDNIFIKCPLCRTEIKTIIIFISDH